MVTIFHLQISLAGTSTIYAYLGEFIDAKTRSRSTMFSSVIFGVLCLFLPAIALLVINQSWSLYIPVLEVDYRPWRLFLVVCGFPSLVCGLSLIFFPESPKFTFSQVTFYKIGVAHKLRNTEVDIFQGDEAKTIEIFRRIYHANTSKKDYPIDKILPNEEFGQNCERKSILKMMLNQSVTLFRDYPRSMGLLSAIQFGMFFVANGMILYFPDIANRTAIYMNASSRELTLCNILEQAIDAKQNASSVKVCVEQLDISAYYYAFILEGCYTGGFFLLSLLVNYVGRLQLFTLISFSTGICGLAIAFISNATIAMYLYVWLLACGITSVLLNTVTYDLFPTNLRALALSVSVMFGRLGSLVGGNVSGLMLEQHCSTTFILGGTILIVTGILTFMIPNIRTTKV